jgi:hypothetical protein
MKHIFYSILTAAVLFFSSCEFLENADIELSEEEIVDGLKTALTVGTDTSVTVLHATDGYYKDEIVKILLPPEGRVMYDYVNQLENYLGSGYLDNTVLRINRAAEDAADEAKPIFVNAVKNMTIQDGMNILQGKGSDGSKAEFDSTAATAYLRVNTYSELVGAYAPKIDHSLSQPLVGNVSATKAWEECTFYYNTYVILFNGEEPIEASLGEYTTGQALDGVFFKIGEEEKKIRKDPYQWGLDILNKVFGYVYEEQ